MFIHKEENNDINLFKRTFQKLMQFQEKRLCLNNLNKLMFNYSIHKSEAQKNIRLKVSTLEGKSTKREADNITTLKNILVMGKHRSDYHIVFMYDGASEYYCNKLSRFISVFERKLRQFIYINVLDTYGKEWVKATLTDEMQAEISKNEKNKNRHIEMALECFTFQDYNSYLFSKRSTEDPKEVIKEAIEKLECCNVSKEEVVNILKKSEKLSLWDKLFKGFNIEFTEGEINKIREIRNDIMHNKEISNLEFTEYKKFLRSNIRKIDEGIFNAEQQNYSDDANIADVLYSLNETMQYMQMVRKNLAKTLSPALKDIQKVAHKVAEKINASGLSEITKNNDLMLKKLNSIVDPHKSKEIRENLAKLKISVPPSFLKSLEGLQESVSNISMPILKSTVDLKGLRDHLSSIPINEINLYTQNFPKSDNLEFESQLENGDEDDTFKYTDVSDKTKNRE